VPVLAAAAYLAAIGGPHWEGDLQKLTPIPARSRALDRELRAEIGAADPGQLLLIRAPNRQAVLQREEALEPLLARLQKAGAFKSADYAARLLPSIHRQQARIAALPDPATLAQRVTQAQAGLPFRPGTFDPFLAAVAASRTMAPLRPADLETTPLGARLDPLLTRNGAAWLGPIVFHGVTDPKSLAAAFAGTGAIYIDMRTELGGILSGYTRQAWRWLGWTGLLVLVVLGAGLRSPVMMLRVLGSVLAAMLVTAALLTAAGLQLSLIHLVALQLVAGVGLDYALFFARRQLDAEERARTLRTLVTCNAMTLLTFGLLAFCQTPLLRDIGVTVACGAFLALVFAFLAAGEAPGPA
jgi:predicted exporter